LWQCCWVHSSMYLPTNIQGSTTPCKTRYLHVGILFQNVYLRHDIPSKIEQDTPASSHVRRSKGEYTNVLRNISVLVISEVTRKETALKTLVCLPFTHLTWLLAREYFIESSHRGSFKLYTLKDVSDTVDKY
jgi:hypothetical protein